MASIFIKKKRDPLQIENTRAMNVKNRWLGLHGAVKAEPHEVLDLGIWAGEYSQIASIELDEVERVKRIDPEAERRAEEEKIRSMPIEERAKQLGRFKIAWWMRSKMRPDQKEPPKEVMDFAYRLALGYYKRNPKAIDVHADVFEPILKEHWGVRRDKMRMSTEEKE